MDNRYMALSQALMAQRNASPMGQMQGGGGLTYSPDMSRPTPQPMGNAWGKTMPRMGIPTRQPTAPIAQGNPYEKMMPSMDTPMGIPTRQPTQPLPAKPMNIGSPVNSQPSWALR